MDNKYINYQNLDNSTLIHLFKNENQYDILGSTLYHNAMLYEVIKRNLLYLFNEKNIPIDFYMIEYSILTNNIKVYNDYHNDIFIKDIISENIDILKKVTNYNIMKDILYIISKSNDYNLFENIINKITDNKYTMLYDIIFRNPEIKPKIIEINNNVIKNKNKLNIYTLLYLKDTNFYFNNFSYNSILIKNLEKMYRKDIINNDVYNFYFIKYLKNSNNLKKYFDILFNDPIKGYA